MIVLWWCTANNRLFELAVHNHLSLSLPLSFSSPSYFLSFSKQAKRKTKLRFADRDPVQDAGPTLALEAAFRTELELLRRGALWQDVEEIVSEQTKLACTTGFLKANLQPLASPEFVDWHHTKSRWMGWLQCWNERGTAADHRTEPKILFGSRPVEPNIRMDFRKDAPLFFGLSHPATARFRRSFRNSVCKTSPMTTICSTVPSKRSIVQTDTEKDKKLFNSGFGRELRSNWHENDNHLLNSPFGGGQRPN